MEMEGFPVGTMTIEAGAFREDVEGTMTNIKAEGVFMAVDVTLGVDMEGGLLQIKAG